LWTHTHTGSSGWCFCRALAERNQDRGEVSQQLHDLWALLGTPDGERKALLAHHHSLRADTLLALEAEAESLKLQFVQVCARF
jgi:hypothetical protein